MALISECHKTSLKIPLKTANLPSLAEATNQLDQFSDSRNEFILEGKINSYLMKISHTKIPLRQEFQNAFNSNLEDDQLNKDKARILETEIQISNSKNQADSHPIFRN